MLKRIIAKSRFWPERLDSKGLPRFDLNFYAVNKKGEYAGAAIWKGRYYSVHDGKENKLKPSAYLFERP